MTGPDSAEVPPEHTTLTSQRSPAEYDAECAVSLQVSEPAPTEQVFDWAEALFMNVTTAVWLAGTAA